MKNFKKIITSLFVLSVTFIFSQEKIKEIKLDKKESLNFLNVAKDGSILYKTNKEVYGVVYRTYKGNKLVSLDKNLETNFEIEVANTFPKGFLKLSTDLEYTINADQLIDKKGNIKEYLYGKKNTYSRLDKKSGLNPVFHFFNDYGWSVIGPKAGRFNAKKKYSEDDIFIFNLRNEDLKGETFVLKSPGITTNAKSVKWRLDKNFKESFFLKTRDKLERKDHNNIIHIVENNYKGEIVSYSKLEINIGKDKYFLTSSEMDNSIEYNRYYYDNIEKSILVYGYYSKKAGDSYNENSRSPGNQIGITDGFYAFKFKKGGELLWRSFIPFSKINKTNYITRGLMFSKFNNEGIFESHLANISGFFKIDLNTGKLKDNSSSLISFFENKKVLRNTYFLKINLLSGMAFSNSFKDKKTNNNKIDRSVLSAMMFKPEIKEFILNRASKKKGVSYNAKFSKENIFITEITNTGRGVKEKTLTIFKF